MNRYPPPRSGEEPADDTEREHRGNPHETRRAGPPPDEHEDDAGIEEIEEGPAGRGCSWSVIFGLALILVLIWIGVWGVNWMRTHTSLPRARENGGTEISLTPAPGIRPGPAETQVQVYYLVRGEALAPEMRQLPESAHGTRRLRLIAEELARPPSSDIKSAPLPPGTTIRGVYLIDNVALIDLSREFLSVPNPSPMLEKLTVYALVNSILLNEPELLGVRLMVEGKPIETAWGWLDLGSPLGPDLSLVK